MSTTRPYIPRVTLVFDFDKTLATSMMDALSAALGLDRDEFENRHMAPLGEQWDLHLQRGHALIAAARDRGRAVDAELIAEAAERIELYPGVLDMPARLRRAAAGIHAEAACEFIVLSAGFAEVVKATPVSEAFDRVLGATFHYENGAAVAVKRIVTHPQKAFYLEAIAKGLDLDAGDSPVTEAPDRDEHEHYVLLDQMIYAGDGASDLKAFGFVERAGGVAVAVRHEGKFSAAAKQLPGQRVSALADPDYREDSELYRRLELAVRAAAARVALRAPQEE